MQVAKTKKHCTLSEHAEVSKETKMEILFCMHLKKSSDEAGYPSVKKESVYRIPRGGC